jgi:nitrite reductase/ring-hydroxylating ferredoxin subunit
MSEPVLSRRSVLITAISAAGCSLLVLNNVALAVEPGAGPVDAGALADYEQDGLYDKFVKTNKFFIRRNGDKLFAISAICTHKNAVLRKRDAGIFCRNHSSTFDADGYAIKGEAKVSLPRHKISVTDGKVTVDTSVEFYEKDYEKDGASYSVPTK